MPIGTSDQIPATKSWYIELAEGEGIDPAIVVGLLAKAVREEMSGGPERAHMAMRLEKLQPLLDVQKVAEILSRDDETVRRYARERILTAIHMPKGAILFDPDILLAELNQYLRPSKFAGD